MVIGILLAVVYGYLLLVALLNRWLMPRAIASAPVADLNFCVLIPARDEAPNLPIVLPPLREQGVQVFVYDDESTDGTKEVAQSLGATVITAPEPLPAGWTGKNRACHALGLIAAEASPAEWYLFLDADTQPGPGFAMGVQELIHRFGARAPVITGFPTLRPGAGLEPVYLGWVPWILLATAPFGLISVTRKGHGRFTNGQFVLWRANRYLEVMPYERVKGIVLEDVTVGRILAREGIRCEVVDLTKILAVKMYQTFRQAVDGMSKNSFQITGSTPGTLFLAFLFLVFGWGWLVSPWLYFVLIGGKWLTDRMVRAPWWTFPLMPITATLASITLIRSLLWHRRGKTEWKGRFYGDP